MARITLADLTGEPTTLDLFDHTYRVLAITRSVQKKLEKVQPLVDALKDEEDSDKVIAALSEGIGVLLAPEDDAPAVQKVIQDAWKADQLSLAQISVLFDRVQEASVARPT